MLRPVAALLPRTPAERRMFVGVALTAGVAEEVVFRGFLLVYLTDVLTVPLGAAMVVSAALFGLAHSYQGAVGVLLTGLAGYWLAGLYVLTGSLLLPAVVHALVDLRLLLALPRRDRLRRARQVRRSGRLHGSGAGQLAERQEFRLDAGAAAEDQRRRREDPVGGDEQHGRGRTGRPAVVGAGQRRGAVDQRRQPTVPAVALDGEAPRRGVRRSRPGRR